MSLANILSPLTPRTGTFPTFAAVKAGIRTSAGLNTTNLTVFEQGHAATLPANTASQHLMDTKFVYQGNNSVITARTYVTATVFQQGTNASFADYNVCDDQLRMEDGSWKIFSRNATALVSLV